MARAARGLPVSCSPRPSPTPGAVGRCAHARPAARPPSTPRPFLALSHLPRRLQAASSNSFLPTLSHRTLPSRPPLGVGAGGRAACDSSRRGSGIFEAKTARAAMARAARAAAPSRPVRRQGCLQQQKNRFFDARRCRCAPLRRRARRGEDQLCGQAPVAREGAARAGRQPVARRGEREGAAARARAAPRYRSFRLVMWGPRPLDLPYL